MYGAVITIFHSGIYRNNNILKLNGGQICFGR